MHGDDAVELERLREQVKELLRLLDQERARRADFEAQIAWLKKMMFGRRSERRTDENTLDLFGEDLASATASAAEVPAIEDEAEANQEARIRRRVGGRRSLPSDLPRRTTEIRPPEADCRCGRCDVEKVEIGREVTERLDFIPASLFVRREERVKLACPKCQRGVTCPPLPARPIERGLPGPGLLAFVLTSKYGEHSTLYRLESVIERHGLEVSRSTMCGWIAAVTVLLDPIVREMKRELLSGGLVQSDDTGVCLLGSEKGGSSRSHLWVYRWGKGLVVYDFTKSRSRDGPDRFLDGFAGYLQADAYSGYDEVLKSPQMTEVACWAHCRRYFVNAETSDPALATEMVGLIRGLYQVERTAKDRDLSPEERLRLRRERSVPILEAIEEWLLAKRHTVLPKSPLGAAVTYALNQLRALNVYVTDGRLEIDNNAAERAMRPVAIGRKNWLFFARETGGERAATIFSLITSCKELGIDPFEYLRDVLDAVSLTPVSRIHDLTPRGWLAVRQSAAVAQPA